MKIGILLPYKENYSPKYPGSISIFLKDINNFSAYKKNTTIYGSTNYSNRFSKNYINIDLKKKFFSSLTKQYLKKFIDKTSKKKIDILEIHNRPNYVKYLLKSFDNIVLYFHNDPTKQKGSKTKSERLNLIKNLKFVVFNSQWTKKKFLTDLKISNKMKKKLLVIHQSTNKCKIKLQNKQKIICFIGRLNSSKGYDLFGKAVTKILDKYSNWKAIVIGDEPREELNFKHKNLNKLGFKSHNYVMNLLKKVSICVVPSRWEEPFGRTALEASSRGCAIIVSNRGGLKEATKYSIKLKQLTHQSVFNAINKLIKYPNLMKNLQKDSIKNFIFTHQYISKKIDSYRNEIIKT